MAQIELRINVETIDELHSALGRLLEGVPTVRSFKGDIAEPVLTGGLQTKEEVADEGERQRRTRRTRAQIEADNLAATSGSLSPSNPSTEKSTPSSTSEPSSGAATNADPFAEQIREAITDDTPVSRDQVQAAMMAWMGHDKTPPTHSALEVQNKLFEAFAVKSIGQLDPAKYSAAIALFTGA